MSTLITAMYDVTNYSFLMPSVTFNTKLNEMEKKINFILRWKFFSVYMLTEVRTCTRRMIISDDLRKRYRLETMSIKIARVREAICGIRGWVIK